MNSQHSVHNEKGKAFLLLVLGTLGVVYGDIGTSPLYAVKESFHHIAPVKENVFGVLCLIFWAVFTLVMVKYVIFVLNFDHAGEGGITALVGLLKKKVNFFYIILGVFGATLLLGDGAITPAISVLSAVEGLEMVTPAAKPYIIPITITILLALFMIQKYGTNAVGMVFGPWTSIWFVVLGVLGGYWIYQYPTILLAINPWYAYHFFQTNGWMAFVVMGSVFLVVTGGEALYADMGHFGKRAVRSGWYWLVMPSLLLNYFGQGALLMLNPSAKHNPFYEMAPEWFLLPLVILATGSTIIASQALISGSFSLTKQLSELHAIPPIEILSTSEKHIGQIYVPLTNRLLMFACISLVLFFQTSTALASAYGLAVTGTMVITDVLVFLVIRKIRHWSLLISVTLVGVFLCVDLTFLAANLLKFVDGGWLPLTIAVILTGTMELYYFRARRLLKLKKKPMNGHVDSTDCSIAIIFVDEYVHEGTQRLITKAKSLHMPYKIVHVCTRAERLPLFQKHMCELGEEAEIIMSLSGDLVRPTEKYALETRDKVCSDVWVLVGQTIRKGDPEELHPNGRAIRRCLQNHKGFSFIIVPWIVEEEESYIFAK